jgi:glutamyl-tRNA synthetase
LAILGRYAPTPSGVHHLGNLRSAVLTWADAALHGGRCALRIDDLDTPRIVGGAEETIRAELAWLGLPFAPLPLGALVLGEMDAPRHPACRQAGRQTRYAEVRDLLIAAGALYPCHLRAKAFKACLSAPHGFGADRVRLDPSERAAYRARHDADRSESVSWRFAAAGEPMRFDDEDFGAQELGAAGLDDFIVWRHDGQPSYQLATVIDDHDLRVNRVVRGADLIPSTFRQLALMRALGWSEPAYRHLALVSGADGERLAKGLGAPSAVDQRLRGQGPQQLLGWVAQSCIGGALIPIADTAALLERLGSARWRTTALSALDLTSG